MKRSRNRSTQLELSLSYLILKVPGTSSHLSSLQQQCQESYDIFLSQKNSVLNVNNLLSQCFHITSSLGLNLRPIQTTSIPSADSRRDNRSRFPWGVSGAQVTQAPELAAPFPHWAQAQHYTWVPVLGLILLPRTLLQQKINNGDLQGAPPFTLTKTRIRKSFCQHKSRRRTELLLFGLPCCVIQVSGSSTEWHTALRINSVLIASDIHQSLQEMIWRD